MSKKVLFVATVDSHIELFHLPYLKMFKDKGWEVHVATDTDKPIKYCDKKIKIPIRRSPFKLSNLSAIKELKKTISEEEYDIVHCHTPMGGVVARLAARKARRAGTRVLYTAHGFHFYKGAPVLNWVLYYPVEKWLSKYTDTLITINTEDFERAKRKFYCDDVHKIHGIGVDENKFNHTLNKQQEEKLRRNLKIDKNDFVITYIAELSKDKGQDIAIKAMYELKKIGINNVKLLLIGKGAFEKQYRSISSRMDVGDRVLFLGFRNDICDILSISDLELATSRREGLGLHIAEAMFLNTPVIVTENRGHKELVENEMNGIVIPRDDYMELARCIKFIFEDSDKKKTYVLNARKRVDMFRLDNVKKEMGNIYFSDDSQTVRVLQVFNTMTFGGAENMIMNIYRNINREKIQFDFLVHGECVFADEIERLGGKIYTLPGYVNELGPIKYKTVLREFFRRNRDYKIVHCHLDITSGLIFDVIKSVYKPICISHAHCCENMKNNFLIKAYKGILKRRLNKLADIKLACSDEAGRWVFGEGYNVINNPIDASNFKMDVERRNDTRKTLGLDNADYIIGTIGRLEPIKNQKLLIDAFKEAFPTSDDIKLLIVGNGSLKDYISQEISNDRRIALLEPVSDVSKYYEVFDLFALPSEKEGFSMVLLEAYCSGLPIIASKGVPKQVIIDTNAKMVEDFRVNTWAKDLKRMYDERTNRATFSLNEKYDVRTVANQLEEVYYGCNDQN